MNAIYFIPSSRTFFGTRMKPFDILARNMCMLLLFSHVLVAHWQLAPSYESALSDVFIASAFFLDNKSLIVVK